MDFYIIFQKKVLINYNLDKLLTPKNLGNGELENVVISILRRKLNFCFLDIESYTLKEKLIEYLEDYLLELRIKIASQKNRVKTIKQIIKKLKKQHPNLDINNNEDELIIEEINNHQWKLDREKYILYYLREQPFFIRDWNSQKRKELQKEWIEEEESSKKTNRLKNSDLPENENIIIPKKSHFYCQIGALFAQNYIYRISTGFDFTYFYKKKKFTNPNKLSKHIKVNILKTKHSVHQYIDETLKDNNTSHNFHTSKTKMNNIIQYCKDNNINIVNDRFIQNPPL